MNTHQHPAENYSIFEGGLFRKVQLKLGGRNHQVLLAIAGICFAWLPLVILTAIDGTLYSGAEMSFLRDVSIQARLLVALPMLILIRNAIDIKTSTVIRYISESLLDEEYRRKILNISLPQVRKLA